MGQRGHVAGILRLGTLLTTTDEDWLRCLSVNATGVFYTHRAVARRMVPRGKGAMVTVASNAARTPRVAMGAYAASKAASVMAVKCLGLELAPYGIRCNIVSPGSTDTPMQRAFWRDDLGPQAVIDGDLKAFRVGIPTGRIAASSDVANAVLYLLSDQARHITMQDLCVDGGATLGV